MGCVHAGTVRCDTSVITAVQLPVRNSMWMFLCVKKKKKSLSSDNGSKSDPASVTNNDNTFNGFDTEPDPVPMFCLARGSSEIIRVRQQRAKGGSVN